MEGRRKNQRAMVTVTGSETINELIARKARVHRTSRGHLSLHVFDTHVMNLRKMKQLYGGGVYSHKGGYVWITGARRNLKRLADEVRQYLPEDGEHGLSLLYQSLK